MTLSLDTKRFRGLFHEGSPTWPEHPSIGFIVVGGGQPSHNIVPTMVEEAGLASIPAYGNMIDFGITPGVWDAAKRVQAHRLEWDEPVLDYLLASDEPQVRRLMVALAQREGVHPDDRLEFRERVFGKVPPQDDTQGIRLAVRGNWPRIEPVVRHQYAELARRGKYRIFFIIPVVYEGPTSTAVEVEMGRILYDYRTTLDRLAEGELRLPDTPDVKLIKLQWMPADLLNGANSAFALEQGLASRMAIYRGQY